MSFASSSSSAGMAIRSATRQTRRCIGTLHSSASSHSGLTPSQTRTYSTPPYPDPTPEPTPSQSYRGSSDLTPEGAQSFISDLLHLPPSKQLPPKLALQILTHKSYRFVSLPRNPYLVPEPTAVEASLNYAASHNARLTFLGRRAAKTYLAMFIHAAAARTGISPSEMPDFLRSTKTGDPMTLNAKIDNLTHLHNVARKVAVPWKVPSVARWDHNLALQGHAIHGGMVFAIIGGVFNQFGSPAAHRAFHLHFLPHLGDQLRDPALIEKMETMRQDLERDLGGGILV